METSKSWVAEAFFYHIYPLGLTGAPRYQEGEKTAGSRILEILDWIPHMKKLGVTAVYFGPIFESHSHGYDTSDYYKTDSRLGTKEDFKKVFSALQENGMRIVLDGVFNHVGREFWAFQDVREKLQQSEYCGWFSNLNFQGRSPMGDQFSYDNWAGNADLVKLNLKNPQVCKHLLEAVKMWIEEYNIDGLRLDAADCVDKGFFEQLRSYTQNLKEDFWLMGEIIHGNYSDWANDKMLHSVTNYECWKGMYSSYNDKNFFEIAHSLKRQFGKGGLYENMLFYNFADNHDVNRIASMLKVKENLKNVYTLMFSMPGIPSVYYGSEWGIEGEKAKGAEADYPLRPRLCIQDMEKLGTDLPEHISKLAKLRRESKALQYGKYEDVLVKNEQLVFARSVEGEDRIVALNLAKEPCKLTVQYHGNQHTIELDGYDSDIYLCVTK